MKQLQKIGLLLVPPTLLLLFIVVTDPYKLPIVLIVIPFILFSVTVYRFSKLFLDKMHFSKRRAGSIAAAITSMLLLLTLLQSIRQLSIKDFLILLALAVGLTFYLRRLDI